MDKTWRLKVTTLEDGESTVYMLAKETDWSLFQESTLEIQDMSGLKAYYPIVSIKWEIT
jgi:hypothetical protein